MYSGLTDGSYTFQVRAIDQASNPDPSPATFTWTVDTLAPDTFIDSAPADPTNSNMATFIFHASEGSTFSCQLDRDPAAACASGVTYNGLAPGPHTFTVAATDLAGNPDTSPASFTWTIDVTAPETTIDSGPADGSTTTNTFATFDFSGTDNLTAPNALTFECSLDGATFTSCPSPAAYSGLSRAPHTFAVQAKDQAGNTDPSPATRTWTITQLTPVITWADPSDITYGTALSGTQLNATADTAGTFLYSPASGTVLNAGNGQALSVQFTPNDTTNYSTANKTVHINVLKANQTITLTGVPASAAYNATFTPSATSTSNLTVTIGVSGVCNMSAGVVTMTSGTGTCTVTASQAGDSNYNAAPNAVATATATKATQTITFGALGNKTFGDPDFAVSATASSGLAVSFLASGTCTVLGTSVHITGAGSCTITAQQGGDSNYSAAADVAQPFSISKANQTITLSGVPASAAYNATFTPSATATSGLTVTIGVSGVCSLSAGVVTMTSGTGTCTVTASQAGDSNYNAAPNVVVNVTATKLNQTISFTGAPASAAFGATFSVSASASSGLSVTVSASGACSVAGTLVTMTSGTGVCALTADQAGDANYNAAPQATQSTNALKANQTITVTQPAPPSAVYNATFDVAATASSGLTVSIGASGVCSIAGSTVTMTSGTGTCTVTFDQAGDANYGQATQVVETVNATQASQTITFGALAGKTYGDADFTVSATGGASGQPVTFTAAENCTVVVDLVHLTGAGSCTITAKQAGNANYAAAPDAPQSFTIAKATAVITLSNLIQIYDGSPKSVTVATNPPGHEGGVSVTYNGGAAPSAAGS